MTARAFFSSKMDEMIQARKTRVSDFMLQGHMADENGRLTTMNNNRVIEVVSAKAQDESGQEVQLPVELLRSVYCTDARGCITVRCRFPESWPYSISILFHLRCASLVLTPDSVQSPMFMIRGRTKSKKVSTAPNPYLLVESLSVTISKFQEKILFHLNDVGDRLYALEKKVASMQATDVASEHDTRDIPRATVHPIGAFEPSSHGDGDQ